MRAPARAAGNARGCHAPRNVRARARAAPGWLVPTLPCPFYRRARPPSPRRSKTKWATTHGPGRREEAGGWVGGWGWGVWRLPKHLGRHGPAFAVVPPSRQRACGGVVAGGLAHGTLTMHSLRDRQLLTCSRSWLHDELIVVDVRTGGSGALEGPRGWGAGALRCVGCVGCAVEWLAAMMRDRGACATRQRQLCKAARRHVTGDQGSLRVAAKAANGIAHVGEPRSTGGGECRMRVPYKDLQ